MMSAIPVDIDDLAMIQAKLSLDEWSAFKNKSLFLTGGTGFVGCWLLEALRYVNRQLDLNLRITTISRNPEAFIAKAPHLASNPMLTLIKGDMCDLESIQGQFDFIIHAATDVVKPDQDQAKVYAAIQQGTDQVLALAKRSGCKQFLLLSSGAVYGRQPQELEFFGEDFSGSPDLTQPKSAYGLGKRYSEWITHVYNKEHGIDTKIARCFAFVGPYMALDAQFAIANFIGDCINQKTVVIGGDGTPYRSYLYAADLVVWLIKILLAGDNKPYNVGSDNALQIAQIAETVIKTLCDGKLDLIIKQQAKPGQIAERYIPSVERALTLGLREYTSLTQAIKKTAIWNQRRN